MDMDRGVTLFLIKKRMQAFQSFAVFLMGVLFFSGMFVSSLEAAVDLTGTITKVKVKEKRAGLKLVVKFDACNVGNDAVVVPLVVSLFKSDDQDLSGDDLLLQSFLIQTTIGSGQCALTDKGKRHKFKVKNLTDLSNSFALVVIDFENVITENDEKNNIFSAAITVPNDGRETDGPGSGPGSDESVTSMVTAAQGEFIYQADNPRGQGSGNILQITKSLGEVSASVALPAGSFALAGLAVGPEYVWVTSPENDKLHRVEKSAFSSVETFDVEAGSKPWGIAVGETRVWVTHQDANKVISYSRIDGAMVDTFDYQQSGVSGRRPWGIAVDNSWVWVANSGDVSGPASDTIIKLFRSNGGFEKEIDVDPHIASLSPRVPMHGILSDGLNVWVVANELITGSPVSSSRVGGSLIQYNIVNDGNSIPPTFFDRTVLGQVPQYLTLNDEHVWVSHLAESFVTKVSKFTNNIVGNSSLPVGPFGRGLSVSGGTVWIASDGLDAINTGGLLKLDIDVISEPATLVEGGELSLSFGDMTGSIYDMIFGDGDI